MFKPATLCVAYSHREWWTQIQNSEAKNRANKNTATQNQKRATQTLGLYWLVAG